MKTLTRSIVSWAIALDFFWEGCASIPFLCFGSLADQIKNSETPQYSEQYFHDQESGTKVNVYHFSVSEAVINFSFTAACSLSSSSALFLVSLSYIGGSSSISISKTLNGAEMFSLSGVLVKFLMVGEANSTVCYHLMAEGHLIQLGV